MGIKVDKVPPMMLLGFHKEDDIRILEVIDDKVQFESEKELEGQLELKICIFNNKSHGYDEYVFDKSSIEASEKTDFSYLYVAKLESSHSSVMKEYAAHIGLLNGFVDFLVGRVQERKKYIESEFFNSFEEQEREWFNIHLSEETNRRFKELASGVELAYAVDNAKLYSRFLEQSFGEAINNGLEKYGLKEHGMFSKPFGRLYIGSEVCPCLFPKDSVLIDLMEKSIRECYNVTVAFPYIREDMLDGCQKTLELLDNWSKKSEKTVEVVVNDWGMAHYIHRNKMHLTPVLGHLQNKRKKDPRFEEKLGFEKYENQLSYNNLNIKRFSDFLNSMGINRYEFEYHSIRNEIPDGSHSLHFPYYQMNTGQYCVLYAECKNMGRWKQELVKACPQYCSEFRFMYPKNLSAIGKGNSIFGFKGDILKNPDILALYIKTGIDRLVFNANSLCAM